MSDNRLKTQWWRFLSDRPEIVSRIVGYTIIGTALFYLYMQIGG